MAALLEETMFDIGNMVSCCSASFITDDINSCILLLKPGKSSGVSACSSDHITILFSIMITRGFTPIDFRLFN